MRITAADVVERLEYSFSTTEESIDFEYKGQTVTVEIEHDQNSDSPYDSGDFMAPALWLGLGSGFTEHGDSRLGDFFSKVQVTWVSRHWRKIAAILDLGAESFADEVKQSAKEYRDSVAEARRGLFSQILDDQRAESWGYGCDYLETLRALYTLAGVPCDTFTRNGYCQGDTIQGLIVLTREWAEKVACPYALKPKAKGAAEKCKKDMESQADQYGAWVWGDCYGFRIMRDGEESDSLWGFVGSDPMESGIAEAIAEGLDSIFADIDESRHFRLGVESAAMMEARPDMYMGVTS